MRNLLKTNLYVFVSLLAAYITSQNEFRTDVMFYFLYFITFVECFVKYRQKDFKYIFQISFFSTVFIVIYLSHLYLFGFIVLAIYYWRENRCSKSIKRILTLKRKYRADKNQKRQEARLKAIRRQKLIEKKHSEDSISLSDVQTFDE